MNIFSLPLFCGLLEEEQSLIQQTNCMRTLTFEKNQTIFRRGDHICEMGLVLHGRIWIENIDLWGNKSILSMVTSGQVFAETYALCHDPMMVDVVTAEPSEILFLNLDMIQRASSEHAVWKNKLMQNILYICAKKNLILSHRIFCTTPKTIRGRLLIYLSAQATKCGSITFQIPFDRQGLADYLNLDRSALSKELGHMRDEGILDFHKNQFTLYKQI